jgi:hypothetical protein
LLVSATTVPLAIGGAASIGVELAKIQEQGRSRADVQFCAIFPAPYFR